MQHLADSMKPSELELALNFLERIPFNQMVGLEPVQLTAECCELAFDMKPELVGNWLQGILHGGAIATALDVTGGAMALISTWQRLERDGVAAQERPNRLAKLGTIDMRVDYLQPGKGERFISSATLLRAGNKVAVTRMELHNEEGTLIAVGTGTYLCG